jgi:hypothetical protein
MCWSCYYYIRCQKFPLLCTRSHLLYKKFKFMCWSCYLEVEQAWNSKLLSCAMCLTDLQWSQEFHILEQKKLQLCPNVALFLRSCSMITKKKHRGLSPRANYTDRVTAACRRSDCQLLRIDRGFHVVSMTDPYGRILGFLDRSRYFSI